MFTYVSQKREEKTLQVLSFNLRGSVEERMGRRNQVIMVLRENQVPLLLLLLHLFLRRFSNSELYLLFMKPLIKLVLMLPPPDV